MCARLASDEDGHGLIGAARLHLEVGASVFLADVALENVRGVSVESDVAARRLAAPRGLLGALVLERGGGEGGQTHHHQFVRDEAAEVERHVELAVVGVLQLRGKIAVFLRQRKERQGKERDTEAHGTVSNRLRTDSAATKRCGEGEKGRREKEGGSVRMKRRGRDESRGRISLGAVRETRHDVDYSKAWRMQERRKEAAARGVQRGWKDACKTDLFVRGAV